MTRLHRAVSQSEYLVILWLDRSQAVFARDMDKIVSDLEALHIGRRTSSLRIEENHILVLSGLPRTQEALMAKRQKIWVWVNSLTKEEKAAIATICDRFIADTLKPRFLPMIRPTEFNYPVDILGKWRGSKYSFITRYRSGFPENLGEEFDAAFTRFDHVEEHLAENRFDVMWHRHTGQWFRLHAAVPLTEGLHLISTEELLQPL